MKNLTIANFTQTAKYFQDVEKNSTLVLLKEISHNTFYIRHFVLQTGKKLEQLTLLQENIEFDTYFMFNETITNSYLPLRQELSTIPNDSIVQIHFS